jgi:RNA polymerase sigma-70 factor (ECF subfamily)
LLERIATGSPAAIAELFDQMAPLVRGLLVRTMGRTDEVDDLVQDVFLVVVRRCRTLDKPEALRSFVVGVTIRTAKKALRMRGLRRWVGLDAAETLPVCPAYDATRAEQVRCAYRALSQLGAQSRLIFALRHIDGLELTDVAAADGCSLATVKRRLARAERQFEALARRDPVLRDLLEGDH